MSRQPAGRDALIRYLRQREELALGPMILSEDALADLARAGAQGGPLPLPTRSAPGSAPQATGVGSEESSLPAGYQEVRETALSCRRCGLCETRTQVVFSDGNPAARLMVIGEAPGANEDRTGLPFVGQAGKLLDLLLAAIDLSRERSVYICNVIKCRPPGNRNPTPTEIEACSPYLRRQIELVSPQVILAVGGFAAQFVTGKKSALGKLRGEVYDYQEVPAIVTYHPAALLRNPGWTQDTWDDLQLLRETLDRVATERASAGG